MSYDEHLISQAGGDGDTMANILSAHADFQFDPDTYPGMVCSCGTTFPWQEGAKNGMAAFAGHQADALTAAGFGPIPEAVTVTDAQWQEAAEMVDYYIDFGEPDPVIVPRTYTAAEMREAKARSLEEAANEVARLSKIGRTPARDCTDDEKADYYAFESQASPENWLRDRAATVRGGE